MLNVGKGSLTKRVIMEHASMEISREIVRAIKTPPGALWDFGKINDLVSEVKNPQLKLMVWQDTCFLLAYFNKEEEL